MKKIDNRGVPTYTQIRIVCTTCNCKYRVYSYSKIGHSKIDNTMKKGYDSAILLICIKL